MFLKPNSSISNELRKRIDSYPVLQRSVTAVYPRYVATYAKTITWLRFGRRYRAPIDPFELIWIDPDDVVGKQQQMDRFRYGILCQKYLMEIGIDSSSRSTTGRRTTRLTDASRTATSGPKRHFMHKNGGHRGWRGEMGLYVRRRFRTTAAFHRSTVREHSITRVQNPTAASKIVMTTLFDVAFTTIGHQN